MDACNEKYSKCREVETVTNGADGLLMHVCGYCSDFLYNWIEKI